MCVDLPPSSLMNSTKVMNIESFYLNIFVKNCKDIIVDKTKEKAGSGLFGNIVSGVASMAVSENTVTSKLGEQLQEKLLDVLQRMGITCNIRKCFQKNAYLCFKVDLVDIDKLTLLSAAKGDAFAQNFSSLLDVLEKLEMVDTALPKIDEKISIQVQNKLIEKFSEKIPVALSENGVDVDLNVELSSNQANFFFDVLDELNNNNGKV